MKTKGRSTILFILSFIVIIFLAFAGFKGFEIGGWEVKNFEKSITKGLDLQGGVSVLMEIKDADELNKKLYIDRKTGKPIKMQIKNVSKNTTVYILYNEIEINSLKRDDVLAFRLKNVYVNM